MSKKMRKMQQMLKKMLLKKLTKELTKPKLEPNRQSLKLKTKPIIRLRQISKRQIKEPKRLRMRL